MAEPDEVEVNTEITDEELNESNKSIEIEVGRFNKHLDARGLYEKPMVEAFNLLTRPVTVGELSLFNIAQTNFNFSVMNYLLRLQKGERPSLDRMGLENRRYMAATFEFMADAFDEIEATISEEGGDHGGVE